MTEVTEAQVPTVLVVAVALIDPDGRILIAKRPEGKQLAGLWEFPGGKVEPGDAGPVAAAQREAEEEIGLPRGAVEILGTLDPHETVTGFLVTPVLARLTAAFSPRPDPSEVEEVFTLPLSHLVSGRFRVESRRWRGRMRQYYVAPFGPYYIWGATARMLRALTDRMGR